MVKAQIGNTHINVVVNVVISLPPRRVARAKEKFKGSYYRLRLTVAIRM